jgi:hypothetical protein
MTWLENFVREQAGDMAGNVQRAVFFDIDPQAFLVSAFIRSSISSGAGICLPHRIGCVNMA